MLEWDSLKKPILAVIIALLAVDCGICVKAFIPQKDEKTVVSSYYEDIKEETSAALTAVFCQYCGAKRMNGAKFCTLCGQKIGK